METLEMGLSKFKMSFKVLDASPALLSWDEKFARDDEDRFIRVVDKIVKYALRKGDTSRKFTYESAVGNARLYIKFVDSDRIWFHELLKKYLAETVAV
ncbi:hypothetical protein [Larkinella knui]|uniref:Uncharacterized protein n=1 Tax=Larkinella knui TaxID=2025310 RepID=A0A3P1CV12_9BACT|nr:hypothetical protein [Larkinella knui]RRB16930.1 hypothetical protein EHT87_01175 [Larkinella knui]